MRGFDCGCDAHTAMLPQANNEGYILAAVDWYGMCTYDELFVALMVASDLSNFNMVPDR